MAKDAIPYLIPLLVTSSGLFYFQAIGMGLFFLGLAIFVAYFFRDPERIIPVEPGVVVSPADGKVVKISTHADGTTRLSIFLSVFNVHINRAPISGLVKTVQYRRGKFKVAFDEAASIENEQNLIIVANGSIEVSFSQIAGILARRIVCWCRPGDQLERGQRIGLIKFGSRVDVFLPPVVILEVKVGDKVRGASSILGRMNS
jgi:phosphatidylserine decarboxylase